MKTLSRLVIGAGSFVLAGMLVHGLYSFLGLLP